MSDFGVWTSVCADLHSIWGLCGHVLHQGALLGDQSCETGAHTHTQARSHARVACPRRLLDNCSRLINIGPRGDCSDAQHSYFKRRFIIYYISDVLYIFIQTAPGELLIFYLCLFIYFSHFPPKGHRFATRCLKCICIVISKYKSNPV